MREPVHRLEDELRLPIIEESITVGKRTVESGRVRIETEVETTREDVRATLTDHQVEVERVVVGRVVAEHPEPRWEGDTYVVPVVDEVAVVETRLVLREEVRITRRAVEREHVQPVEVRRTLVHVERNSNPNQE